MNVRFVLMLAALVSAVIGTALGFGWLDPSGDPHLAGWICLTLGFWITSDLIDDR